MSLTFPRELFMDIHLNTLGRQDISPYVRQTDPVFAKGGEDDEQGEPQSFLTATLNNEDGRFTKGNPRSPYYGLLRPNVEVRWGFWLAQDTMARTVANGWGTTTPDPARTPTSTDVWTSVGTASQFAVTPSVATHTIPGTGQFIASVMGTPKRNVYQKIDYTPAFTNVTGAAIEPANFLFRRVDADNMYIVRIEATTAEAYTVDLIRRWFSVSLGAVTEQFVSAAAFTVPGLTHTNGQKVSIAAAIEGRTVSVKIWLASDPEPASWQVSIQDNSLTNGIMAPGQWGVRSGVATGNTNTPVTFTYSGYEARDIRAAGELSELTPDWDLTHRIKTAKLRADGILRRLRQNKPPPKSTLRRGIENASGVVGYWHCEDGTGAAEFSSGIPNGVPMSFTGTPTLASDDTFACSLPLPVWRGSKWIGAIRPYTPTGSVTFQFLVNIPAAGSDGGSVIGSVYMTGSLWYADILYHTGSGGMLSVKLYDRSNTLVHDTGPITFVMDGKPARVQLNLNNNGADISGTIAVYKPLTDEFTGYFALSASAVQVASAETVFMNANSLNNDVSAGQVIVYKEDVDILALLDETKAYDGEQAVDRFPRLCAENNIPYVLHAETLLIFLGEQRKMGPQRPEALLKLLLDCIAVDGRLYESRNTVALGYRSEESMYAQDSALDLDYAAGEVGPPLAPAPDDFGLLNDILAKRSEGGEFRSTQTTGPRNVNEPKDDVEGVGRYEDELDPTPNTHRVEALRDIADSALLRGTTTETRYPRISLELAADTIDEAQAYAAMDVAIGDRLTVGNLTDADIYLPIDQLAIGYEETLVDHYNHKIAFNTVPSSPYNVLTLETDDCRVDGDVLLAEAVDLSETSIDVTPVGGLLTTSAGDHPYQVIVNGELWTVTACAGAGPTQTLTVLRGQNGGWTRTHLINDKVLLYPDVFLGR